jgi:hypothetical protein
MALIRVQLPGATSITELDESLLRRTTGTFEDTRERSAWVEYCLADCDGRAHVTCYPDAPGKFCAQHVHRSAAVELKEGLVMETGVGGVGAG